MLEGGCCLAESLGCGPQLLLVAPNVLRRSRTSLDKEARGRGFLLAAIATYQSQISPRRRACCRYTPTCSHYAAEALQTHGVVGGSWLAGRRLLRCRPGRPGGWDPVPPRG
ncbi:MAG: membrane protein insertion efficiency factor YidD [Jatrophihabitans sp.]|uniref:membrane protein insertion efficiency factor YidD n=1 Tax=Jatrophihabitans sp. TaxID=1932789 RepID=UPI003913D4EB